MSIESAADRLAMLQKCGGEQVVLFASPYETTVWAIIDKDYVDVNGVESYHPTALVRTSDITNADSNYQVVHGSALVASSVSYTVIGMQQDGQGMTTLVLQEA